MCECRRALLLLLLASAAVVLAQEESETSPLAPSSDADEISSTEPSTPSKKTRISLSRIKDLAHTVKAAVSEFFSEHSGDAKETALDTAKFIKPVAKAMLAGLADFALPGARVLLNSLTDATGEIQVVRSPLRTGELALEGVLHIENAPAAAIQDCHR